ncbi:YybH family protein [Catalinimonas niigatensis]|uniref:YybH family protein n=1 Tax=Catalinimonas niigatensis TaxID=1397264 RepID=UPI002664F249|nr:SgcJ/EcaC family oxidoreductase [Catalinimonas niigatensis]WPP49866.1 SgcJ/EcaC family oxidoreductase [Catalinimonas niigatensis]
MKYSEADSPERIPKIFVEAWNQRDAAKLASLFDEDAEFINVTGLWWHNRAAIEKAHDYGLRAIFKQSRLKLVQTKVKFLSEKIAVVQAKMKLSGQTPTDEVKNPGTRRNIFTFIVHQSGGKWTCASAQNTDIVPNMETHVRDEKGQLKAVDYRKSNDS